MSILQKLLKPETLIIALILITSMLVHGTNMFHFPYYENDEGTYMSYGWSIFQYGTFDPYTYWYDHSPAGWILIDLWVAISGGFFTFGSAVNSGRVLIFIIHIVTTLLIYLITKKFAQGRIWPAILACAIFIFSPLELYFGRRVLLDNLMPFWVLLSLWFLLKEPFKLRYIYYSALSFGIAALTKENAIFFIPPFLYTAYLYADKKHTAFALIKWLAVSLSVISLYFLYALLKHELFPTGFMGDTSEHVSLIGTMQFQLSRGNNLPFWNTGSDFYTNLTAWMSKDKIIMYLALISQVLGSLLAIKVKTLRIPLLFSLFFLIFLIRGSLIIEFYIMPLLPFIAINTALIADQILKKLTSWITPKNAFLYIMLMLALAFVIPYYQVKDSLAAFHKDETTAQINATNWIKTNLNEDDVIVIDDYDYIELHDPKYLNSKVFKNADWYWKVHDDPAVRDKKYNNDYHNLTYIALTHQMTKQMQVGTQDQLRKAFQNSDLVTEWLQDSTSYRDLPNLVSTNGDWVSIYKQKSREQTDLEKSWAFYKQSFIKDGQVIDPSSNTTTSEGQSYALLRSVYQNDQPTFDSVLNWTKQNLQIRPEDKLFTWQSKLENGNFVVKDKNTASDADEDIALALIFASKKWTKPEYLEEAKIIISDIWTTEVVTVKDKPYITIGASQGASEGYLINPSYFSPASYKIFAELDPAHPWTQLADNTYDLLNNFTTPPNWTILNKKTGTFSSAKKYMGPDSDKYSFDAFRSIFRVSLDAQWFQNPKALAYLNKTVNKLPDSEALSISTGKLSALIQTNPTQAQDMYTKIFKSKYNSEGYWGDKTNYYDQNWAYFVTAFYTNNLNKI